MKKRLGSVLLPVVALLCGGCLVRALHPWLPAETRVADPSLAGAWHDAEKECVVFFNAGAATNYAVLMVQEGKDLSRFGAALHRIDDTLLARATQIELTVGNAAERIDGALVGRVDEISRTVGEAAERLEGALLNRASQIERTVDGAAERIDGGGDRGGRGGYGDRGGRGGYGDRDRGGRDFGGRKFGGRKSY